MTAFWNGSKPDVTTLWPSNLTPANVISLMKEAASKFTAQQGSQQIKLSNGILAKLVVYNGEVVTFYPVSGPGVVLAKHLVRAVR